MTDHGDCSGYKKARLYRIWSNMIQRCRRLDDACYKGITVHTLWRIYTEFKEWAEASGYTDDLTIDRIDPSLGYTPANCRWIPLRNNVARKAKDGRETPSSRFIGVRRNGTTWRAQYKSQYLGNYATEYEAFKAREEAIILGLVD
jgi:hypothetical protein